MRLARSWPMTHSSSLARISCGFGGRGPGTSAARRSSASSCLHTVTHLSQMYTLGPATSFFTSLRARPQNAQRRSTRVSLRRYPITSLEQSNACATISHVTDEETRTWLDRLYIDAPGAGLRDED